LKLLKHYFVILLILQVTLVAQPLTLESITTNLQHAIATKLKGKNGQIVKEIYAHNHNQPLWIEGSQSEKMSELIQALKDPLFNYKNKPFDQKNIKKLLYYLDNNTIDPDKKAAVYARLDLLLTNSFVRLVRFIVQGDVDWALVQKKFKALEESNDIKATWQMHPKPFPPHQPLIEAAIDGDIYSYLSSLLPLEDRYRTLVSLLNNYRRMEKFPKIPYSTEPLKLGDRNERVLQVKKRLQISGDYPKSAPLDKKFDEVLRQAVITYQKRYLLEVTGEVDRTMTWYLNQPARTNIQAIITNLDKTKLYPRSFEEEYIEVNVPDFNLRYYIDGEMVMKKGVVVGRIDRPTPIFDDKMEYVVINPTWTIPDNLIKRDLIHVLRENPYYLQEHNIHVFRGNKEVEITQEQLDPYEHSKKRVPWRFVQFPGDDNALGRIKFMFPNKYAVYIHDTDNKTLFSRRYKVYSSGCMRVSEPFELAKLVLRHAKGSWDDEKISEIIATNKPTTIRLKEPIPVHIVYFTVYVEDGLAYFKHDIYLYDKIIEESTAGNKKPTFSVPKKRMITIKKQKREQKPLSN